MCLLFLPTWVLDGFANTRGYAAGRLGKSFREARGSSPCRARIAIRAGAQTDLSSHRLSTPPSGWQAAAPEGRLPVVPAKIRVLRFPLALGSDPYCFFICAGIPGALVFCSFIS